MLSFCRSVMQFQSNVTYARASSFHSASGSVVFNDDVIKWKYFPRYWPFVRGIHRSPVNSPHKGQWHGALMFCLICAWTRGWVNNRDTGVLRRHCGHYSVTVMWQIHFVVRCRINETLRITLWNKINAIDSGFAYLDDKISFATWCLVVTEIYYHGLGNLCISHLIYVIKRYMDLPRHVQIYQPWYDVWPIYSAIVVTKRKRSYPSAEITRYDFSLHLCIFYRIYVYFICCVV